MKSEKLRDVPTKNYVILGFVILGTILILYYFYLWFDAYNTNRLSEPILDKYMDVINYNEIDSFIVENPDTIMYVSVLEDNEIRKFEKEFKYSFKNNEIDVDILYLDLTNELKDNKLKKEIKDKYLFNSNSIIDVPCIVVFENGMLKSIYNIKENDYDVDRLITYINNIKFSGSDVYD